MYISNFEFKFEQIFYINKLINIIICLMCDVGILFNIFL